MDTEPLEAQLRSDEAKIKEAQDNRRTALAEVAAKQAEFNYSDKQYKRSKGLVARGAVSEQEADVDRAHMETTRAGLLGSQAQAVRTNPQSMRRPRMRSGSRPKSRIACSRHQLEDGFNTGSLSLAKSFRPVARCLRWST